MKTKRNVTRICWALWACVICLSGTTQSRGQTTEQLMYDSYGFEPVVNCDRRTDTQDADKRVQYLWTDNNYIYRRISHDLGANWGDTAIVSDNIGGPDPFATCDIWSTNNSVPRIMYFGWFGGTGADEFARSLSDENIDSGPESTHSTHTDRPWLAVDTANLYLSTGDGNSTNNKGHVKRARIPSGTGTVDWTEFNEGDAFTSSSSTSLASNFPIAAHIDSGNTERVFLMALQHEALTDPQTCAPNNFVLIQRSLNRGVDWQDEEQIKITGYDGFVYNRDTPML
jgi:hypothetical protein